jgi:hypothetical protein
MTKPQQLSYVLHNDQVMCGGIQNGKRQRKLEKLNKLWTIVKEHLMEDNAKTLAHYTLKPNKYNENYYEIFLKATKALLHRILMEHDTSKKAFCVNPQLHIFQSIVEDSVS